VNHLDAGTEDTTAVHTAVQDAGWNAPHTKQGSQTWRQGTVKGVVVQVQLGKQRHACKDIAGNGARQSVTTKIKRSKK
jgi:hypothetical protein